MKVYKANATIHSQGVQWLEIIYDPADTGGYFVFYHVNENLAYDTWHKDVDGALECGEQCGVGITDWEPVVE